MAEPEFFEAVAAWASNGLASFTVFVSFTFAFLTACHFVGRDLTRGQAMVLQVLYIISAGSAAGSNLTSFDAMRILIRNHPSDLDDSYFFHMELWMVLMSVITVAVMAASLYFLRQVRKP